MLLYSPPDIYEESSGGKVKPRKESGFLTRADARETAWELVAAPCARTSYIMSGPHVQSRGPIRTGLDDCVDARATAA